MKCVGVWEWDCFQWDRTCLQRIWCSRRSVRKMWRSELARFTLERRSHAPSPGVNLRAGSRGPRAWISNQEPSCWETFVLCLEIWNGETRTESVQEIGWVNLGVLAGCTIGKVQQAIGYLSLRFGVWWRLGISWNHWRVIYRGTFPLRNTDF